MRARVRCCDCRNTYEEPNIPSMCAPCKKRKFEFVDFVDSTPTERQREFLSDKNLIEKIILESEKRIVGERGAKKGFILGFNLRLVENSTHTSSNFIPHEVSGTGKDYTTREMGQLCVPKKYFIYRSRISPTTLTYWHTMELDPEWTWNGKVLYLEDISDSVLNCEVFKTFLSGGSKATVTYRQRAIDIGIRGKPTLCATTANSIPAQETLRRIQLLPLDASEEQTKRIKKFQSQKAAKGIGQDFNPFFNESFEKLNRVRVAVPFADLIEPYFPNLLIVRTLFERFLDSVKSSAALHQFDRKITSEGLVEAQKEDYEHAREVFNYSSRLTKNLLPVTVHQNMLLNVIKEKSQEELSGRWVFTSELLDKVNLSKQGVYDNLDKLIEMGLLKADRQAGNTGRIEQCYKPVEIPTFSLPPWDEIVANGGSGLTNLTDLEQNKDGQDSQPPMSNASVRESSAESSSNTPLIEVSFPDEN